MIGKKVNMTGKIEEYASNWFPIIEQVDIADIDSCDETYRVSSHDDNVISDLALSIELLDLLRPPILIRRSPEDGADLPGYLIVSGFRRIKAMEQANRNSFPVKLVGQTQKGAAAAAAVMENAFQRELNPMEQVRAVSLLKKVMHMDSNAIADCSRAIFNTPMNAVFVEKLLYVGSMSAEILQLLEQNRISLTAALKLKKYGSDIQGAIASLFAKIKISSSKQNEIITHLHEITAREGISLGELLTWDGISQIVDQDDMDENRKGNLIRTTLYGRRYPELSRVKERFAQNFKLLNKEQNLKGELKLDPPMNFEAQNYTFSLQFRDVKELRRKADKLSTVSRSPLMERIIP